MKESLKFKWTLNTSLFSATFCKNWDFDTLQCILRRRSLILFTKSYLGTCWRGSLRRDQWDLEHRWLTEIGATWLRTGGRDLQTLPGASLCQTRKWRCPGWTGPTRPSWLNLSSGEQADDRILVMLGLVIAELWRTSRRPNSCNVRIVIAELWKTGKRHSSWNLDWT